MPATSFGMAYSKIILIFCLVITSVLSRKSDSRSLIEDITDAKDFKKLLRTKTNVMVLFGKTGSDGDKLMNLYSLVAEEIKGQATLAYIDCNSEGKKVCKKLKVTPEPTVFKHYKDGEFHKDYDRKLSVQSMTSFLKDPTGDVPWDEEEDSQDVVHVPDATSLSKMLHKEKLPVMVMFYAPWCGFCKKLKPDYSSAASDLKSHSILAAMDVHKPENAVVRRHFNITGFPTLLYFENGNLKFKYEGENTKADIIKFMKNPTKQPEKPKEQEWAETVSDVVHLTDSTFDAVMQKENSILVMFYAPWCGHCKKLKPDYVEAATKLKEGNIPGILAALDATKEKVISEKFKITGYPSLKYFKDGEYAFDVNLRNKDKIYEFMVDPKEPPPPPPPEIPWAEQPSDVVHLDNENFNVFLKRKKHVLVMFYAPWCGHCKKAKPEFQAAASHYKDDSKVEFAAVDCTVHSAVCSSNDIKGYPTITYFNYMKNSRPYEGARSEADFIAYMKDPQASANVLPPSPPSPQQFWEDIPGFENLHHLSVQNFNNFIETHDSVLVMFYAPWCGHCKAMKPAFVDAATKLKAEQVSADFAAVDATVERELASRYDIRGFPTVKYFRKGQFIAEYDKARSSEELVKFMKSPPTSATKEEL